MDLVNVSGMSFAPLVGWKIRPPAFSVTFVVKGSFDLVPGGPARLADEQLLPTGDEPYGSEDDPDGSLRYASDFAHFKPRADLLVVGSCHAPANEPVREARASFSLGPCSKSLVVVSPEPFLSQPLRYEYAPRGPGNPIGSDRPRIRGLGFGPIPLTWPQRLSKAGTYDATWLRERWPYYPADFDWTFCNSAPEDQQLRGFVRGDEDVALENLNREHPRLRSRLPGWRVRLFRDPGFVEVPMGLDTVWIDADALRLILVWRGVCEVASEFAEDVARILIAREALSEPRDAAAYRAVLEAELRARRGAEKEFEAVVPPPWTGSRTSPPPVEPAAEEDPDELDARKIERDIEAGLASLRLTPLAPPDVPILPIEQVQKELARRGFTESFEEEPEPDVREAERIPPPPRPPRREAVRERIARKESLAGADLTGAGLYGMDLSGADFRGAILRRADLRGAQLAGADFTGANFAEADLTGARATGAIFAGADFTEARLEDVEFSRTELAEAHFSYAILKRARLAEAKAAGGLFPGADLSDADLRRALLDGADFTRARMHRADLGESRARGATFRGAWGGGLRAVRADLTGIRAVRANFGEGDFSHASARESVWIEAKLYRARFECSELTEADFSSAYLEESSFLCARLREARLAGAGLVRAGLVRADLFRASLEKADLTGADVRESNLYEAEFFGVRREGADFRGANLRRTKLA